PMMKNTETIYKGINNFITYCNQTYDIEMVKRYTLNTIDDSFFKPGIYIEIDNSQSVKDAGKDFFDNLCYVLSRYIHDNSKGGISVKKTKKDNFYIRVSKSKGE